MKYFNLNSVNLYTLPFLTWEKSFNINSGFYSKSQPTALESSKEPKINQE